MPEQVPPLVTSFGIEFEFVLAFHESELRRVLAENNIHAEIKKTLTQREHEAFLGQRTSPANRRSHYPSWGLAIADIHQDPTISSRLVPSISHVRRYFVEPLLIAQNILQPAGCPVNVIGTADDVDQSQPAVFQVGKNNEKLTLRDGNIDYDQWNLTDDQSLLGATKEEMVTKFPDRIRPENKMDWDSSGVELISRKFEASKTMEAMDEIRKYLSALRNDTSVVAEPSNHPQEKTWGAMESIWAGTHVHVGLNVSTCEEIRDLIPTLQHVAYIIFSHEDLITQFHPRSRSGEKRDLGWYLDIAELMKQQPGETEEQTALRTLTQAIKEHTGYKELSSNIRYLEKKQLPKALRRHWSDIRDAIFVENTSMVKFVKLVQKFRSDNEPYRGFFVNFSNLYDYELVQVQGQMPRKPTIEFRQHACTLNVEDLHHWVKLLFAIFKASEAKVQQNTTFGGRPLDPDAPFAQREGSKYLKSEAWHDNTVDDLCGPSLLDLEESEIEYWKHRYEKYNISRPIEEDENITVLASKNCRTGQIQGDYSNLQKAAKMQQEKRDRERDGDEAEQELLRSIAAQT